MKEQEIELEETIFCKEHLAFIVNAMSGLFCFEGSEPITSMEQVVEGLCYMMYYKEDGTFREQ